MEDFSRIRRLPPYVFALVGDLKMRLRRQNIDIVDFSMGNPDIPTPPHIVEKLVEAAQKPVNHRYSLSRGIPNLRKAICDRYARNYGVQLDPDSEAIVTLGCKEGLAHLSLAMLEPGDVVLALPSSGFHSNGYSLVRKVFDVENTDLNRYYDELGETLGEALLRPTVIYVKPVLRCIDAADVRGVSHITGGGFYENIPRCIPDGLCAKIDKAAIRTPAVFGLLQAKGGIDEHDMFNTFNMGVGMVVVVSHETAEAALGALRAEGIDAYVCGEIVTGEEKISLC